MDGGIEVFWAGKGLTGEKPLAFAASSTPAASTSGTRVCQIGAHQVGRERVAPLLPVSGIAKLALDIVNKVFGKFSE